MCNKLVGDVSSAELVLVCIIPGAEKKNPF